MKSNRKQKISKHFLQFILFVIPLSVFLIFACQHFFNRQASLPKKDLKPSPVNAYEVWAQKTNACITKWQSARNDLRDWYTKTTGHVTNDPSLDFMYSEKYGQCIALLSEDRYVLFTIPERVIVTEMNKDAWSNVKNDILYNSRDDIIKGQMQLGQDLFNSMDK